MAMVKGKYKREYLFCQEAYDIMPVGKNDESTHVVREKPQRLPPLGFFYRLRTALCDQCGSFIVSNLDTIIIYSLCIIVFA